MTKTKTTWTTKLYYELFILSIKRTTENIKILAELYEVSEASIGMALGNFDYLMSNGKKGLYSYTKLMMECMKEKGLIPQDQFTPRESIKGK